MSESTHPTVTINGIDPDAMSELIEYAYTCNQKLFLSKKTEK